MSWMKWGSKRRSIPEPVCWLAVLLVLHLVAVDGQLDDDEGFIEGLTVNGTKVALPVQGKPVTGRLRVLQHDLFAFRVLNKEAEGLGFPDVHLSLDVENEGANADIFCLPYAPENPDFRSPPGPRNAVWQSAHSTGIDNVLISTNSTFYRMGTNASFSQETDMKQTAAFICAVWGMSLVIANYRLELDLDYEKRSLVAKEESAVRSIFDKCCMKSGCRRWKRLGEFVVGTDPQGALPVLDLCHVIGNFCDGDGHLVSLSMRSYGLDCDFPLKEIGNFSRIENVDLSLNNLRASVGEVAGGLKKLEMLNRFSAVGNNITGSLGDERLCQLASSGLQHLKLSQTDLTGPLAPCLFDGNSTLTEVFLDSNDIASTLPPSFSQDSRLEYLSLVNTNMTGSLPNSLGQLERLRVLNLANNNFSGKLPPDIGQSPFLESVYLKQNRFSGAVPESLATSQILRTLDLSDNMLTGMPGMWNTQGVINHILEVVRLRSNSIKGPLPAALLTSRAIILDLSDNKFGGTLPVLDNLLQDAWSINMSSNEIGGSIPEEWGSIGLINGSAFIPGLRALLDLSDNQLSGKIPNFLMDRLSLHSSVFFTMAINLEGNDFDCVPIAENETVNHLRGVEACEPEPKEPNGGTVDAADGEGVPETEAPSRSTTAGSQTTVVATQADNAATSADSTGSSPIAEISDSDSDKTAAIVLTLAGVLLFIIVVVVVAILIRRRRFWARHAMSKTANDSSAVELGPGVQVKFERYTDV